MNIRRQCSNFQFEEDPVSKNAEGISKFYHEVLFLNFLQRKPHVTKRNTIYMICIMSHLKLETKNKL